LILPPLVFPGLRQEVGCVMRQTMRQILRTVGKVDRAGRQNWIERDEG